MALSIRSFFKASLVTLFVVGACEPGSSAGASATAPSATLTADAPVTAYEVTVCVTGGETPGGMQGSPRFSARANTPGGSSVELTVESLALEPGDDELVHTNVGWVRDDFGDTHQIGLVEEVDWDGSGTRCTEPEVVQLSVPELAEGQVVEIFEVEASVSASWFGTACSPDFSDDQISIEIVPL